MSEVCIRRLDSSDTLSWPLEFEVSVGPSKNSSFQDVEAQVEAMIGAVMEDLKIIDGSRFEGALAQDEFIGVLSGTYNIVKRGIVQGGVINGPVHGVVSMLLSPICGASIKQVRASTIEKVESEVLHAYNHPDKGFFTRRVEWRAEANVGNPSSVILCLDVRKGFADWLEKDKLREAAELEQEKAEEELSYMSRPKSAKEAFQAVKTLSMKTLETLRDSLDLKGSRTSMELSVVDPDENTSSPEIEIVAPPAVLPQIQE
mmetsp:Transcript_12492/g.23193  ORF Transcript_12492/g.23193 Transcript_12492/m.23193 type:complete len:259 (+) Transcript_12492:51-827(+)